MVNGIYVKKLYHVIVYDKNIVFSKKFLESDILFNFVILYFRLRIHSLEKYIYVKKNLIIYDKNIVFNKKFLIYYSDIFLALFFKNKFKNLFSIVNLELNNSIIYIFHNLFFFTILRKFAVMQ